MDVVGLIGYGRFGRLLATLLASDFLVKVHDPDVSVSETNIQSTPRPEVLKCTTIFYAVPIGQFEEVLEADARTFASDSIERLIIDVCSVKLHPRGVCERHLPLHVHALLTHPMFGPDSVQQQGLEKQPIVLDKFTCPDIAYQKWKSYFESKGLVVVELSSDDHDRLAARSQGLAHYIGRVLDRMKLKPTPIDTYGARLLNTVCEQTCNDTWELFSDLQTYNPHTVQMRIELGEAVQSVYAALIPNRRFTSKLVLGIQGGNGSFNEEAARYYLARAEITDYELVYLYTTRNVLMALHEGRIDRGLFAIHNSVGGMVQESVEAMADIRFSIVEQFSIKIRHSLMIHPESTLEEVTTIMTHPQVLKQCKNTLEQKYPRLKRTSGDGELIDHSNVARNLVEGTLPRSIAVMGSRVLAEIYGLHVVEHDLQDMEQNFTSFMFTERPSR